MDYRWIGGPCGPCGLFYNPRLGDRPIHLLLLLDWRSCGTCGQNPQEALDTTLNHIDRDYMFTYIYMYIYIIIYIYSTHVFYIYMFWILQYRCTRFTYIDIACEYLVTWVSNNFPASMALTKPMSISWQEMAGDGGSICRLVDMFHVLNSCHIHSPWCHGLFLKRFQI